MKYRHIKSTKRPTWTKLRFELKQICEQNKISKNEFQEVKIHQWENIISGVWNKFSEKQNSRWIWETLRHESSSVKTDYSNFQFENIINREEQIWFLFGGKLKYWIYEGTVAGLDKVFWESNWTEELIVVSKKWEWILILNHHDFLIGTGIMRGIIDELY